MSNLQRLKDIYVAWGTPDAINESIKLLTDILADNVHLDTVLPNAGVQSPPGSLLSRQDMIAYFTGILQDWDLGHFTPGTYVDEGDKIAMFGTCKWRNKATGKTAECMISNLWVFENGKVVSFTDLFDSGVAVAAATP